MEVLLALAVLLILMALKVPIAFALLGAGTVGLLVLDGVAIAAASLANVPYNIVSSSTLIVIPMFVALGMFAKNGGVAERLFILLQSASDKLPGGLGIATIATSAGFGAVSGSSVATVSTVGRLSMSQMLKNGYNPGFAAGTLAAGGTLGILIPPSIALVIYGSVTDESIGLLLIAGIVPGLISAFAYAAYVFYRAIKDPEAAGRKPRKKDVEASADKAPSEGQPSPELSTTAIELESAKWTRAQCWFAVVEIAILFGIIIGGIYTGIMTPSESAAVGAVVALLLMFFDLRKGGVGKIWAATKESVKETIGVSTMIFGLLIGASIFSTLIVRSGIPREMVEFVTDQGLAPLVVVALILLVLVPLGMFVDGMSMILIVMPIAYPVVSALGIDGIWFGILAIKLIELGLLTPPVGLNAFVAARTAKGLKPETVFKGLIPYWCIEILLVIFFFAFPAVILWLPNLVG